MLDTTKTFRPARNPHEARARAEKAAVLTVVLTRLSQRLGQPLDLTVARMTDATWTLAAKEARVNPPSETTKALVRAMVMRGAA